MSEAKRKAKELVDRFRMYDVQICDLMFEELDGYEERHYKKCALICVDEMIKYGDKRGLNWLREVKQEIEKL